MAGLCGLFVLSLVVEAAVAIGILSPLVFARPSHALAAVGAV